jgi:hypothetical protein
LIWVKLDQDWKELQADTFQYEPCWYNIYADDPPTWQGDTLRVQGFGVTGGASKTWVATYRYKRPRE